MNGKARRVLVLGLGDTGLSCVRWLARHGARLRAADTRAAPPALGAVRAQHPDVRVVLGPFDASAPGGRGRGRCESGRCASRTAPSRRARTRPRGRRRRRDLRARDCARREGRSRARSDGHQRQVHRDGARRRRWRAPPGCARRPSATSALPVLDALGAAEAGGYPDVYVVGALELPARDHALAGTRRRGDAQRHAGPPRPLRLDRRLRARQGAHLPALRRARGEPRRRAQPRDGRRIGVLASAWTRRRTMRNGASTRPAHAAARRARAARGGRDGDARACTTRPTRSPRTRSGERHRPRRPSRSPGRCASSAGCRTACEPVAAGARACASTTTRRAPTSAPPSRRSRASASPWC